MVFPDGWKNYKEITIQNAEVAGDLTDFPAVYNETDTDLTKARADGFDFVVTNFDGTVVIPYERVLWNDVTGEIILWIKTDPLGASDVTYRLYYNNASETVDQSDVANVWTNGYVAVWHMEEANVVDSSGTVSDGTNNGTTDGSSGVIGNERLFDDASSQWIDLGDTTNLDGATACTFEGWIVADSINGGAIMRKWAGGGQSYIFGLFGSDELQITIRDGSGQLNTETTNANLSTATRYYVVGIWSGGNNRKIIIDGTIEPTLNDITAGNPTDIADTAERLGIGARYNGGSPDLFFDGQIDEVRQSDVARSDEWIETTYDNINAPSSFWSTGIQKSTGFVHSQGIVIM